MEFDKAASRGQDVITICKYLKHSKNRAGEKSEKHRVILLGGTLKIISLQILCHGQRHLAPDQISQSPIQTGLGHFHCHSFPGHPAPHHSYRENFFLTSKLNRLSFSVKPSPLVLWLHVLAKSLPSALWQARLDTGRCCDLSLKLLFSRTNNPNALSLPSESLWLRAGQVGTLNGNLQKLLHASVKLSVTVGKHTHFKQVAEEPSITPNASDKIHAWKGSEWPETSHSGLKAAHLVRPPTSL